MKNILFLTHLYPYPPDDGGRIVTFNTLNELNKYGHNIYLCTFAEKNEELNELPIDVECSVIPFNYENNYSKLLKNIYQKEPFNMKKYINIDMERAIKHILEKNKIDIVYIDHLHMAYYAKFINELNSDVKFVLRQHNVESTIFERAVKEENNFAKKMYLKLQHKKLYKYESEIVSLFEKIYTITEEDKKRLYSMNSKVEITNLPAGVDVSKYFPMENENETDYPTLVFLGTMSWLPNINGIEWFLDEVFPGVLKVHPNTKLYIVGKNPPEKIYRYQKQYAENIVITGYVEDERDYVVLADAFIVPLRIGGGMRIKILNALAMRKPVVTTTIGVEGINLGDNSLLVADSSEEFLNATLKLIQDKPLSKRISTNGWKDVTEKYTNESILYHHAKELELSF
ncbi:glycosyltransferase family 4 protein [Priestia megaterium]|uniref:glycosyltransferase family 4 protein n=1 Tax=Priestia megaterium TaxID=1404 RepID=UPI000C99B8E1|nr:glycosyltransferase family 4 protein [Priestia megaterium]PNE05756.1 glycosyl transferase family 1 [Priestia megaterium]